MILVISSVNCGSVVSEKRAEKTIEISSSDQIYYNQSLITGSQELKTELQNALETSDTSIIKLILQIADEASYEIFDDIRRIIQANRTKFWVRTPNDTKYMILGPAANKNTLAEFKKDHIIEAEIISSGEFLLNGKHLEDDELKDEFTEICLEIASDELKNLEPVKFGVELKVNPSVKYIRYKIMQKELLDGYSKLIATWYGRIPYDKQAQFDMQKLLEMVKYELIEVNEKRI